MPPQTESLNVQPPQVAGAFYPAGRSPCAEMVTSCLARARPTSPMSPKVVVAPHAGWVYSGDVAATVLAPLAARRRTIRRAVIVGPAHRVGFDGLATTSAKAWATPLGTVPVDRPALDPLLSMPGFRVHDAAFAGEHSLEVHLPFLQRVLDDFTIVPILVGGASHTEAARALERVWGGPETLILVSTDLSHFHPYETARRLDRATARRIELLRPDEIDGEGACGHGSAAAPSASSPTNRSRESPARSTRTHPTRSRGSSSSAMPTRSRWSPSSTIPAIWSVGQRRRPASPVTTRAQSSPISIEPSRSTPFSCARPTD